MSREISKSICKSHGILRNKLARQFFQILLHCYILKQFSKGFQFLLLQLVYTEISEFKSHRNTKYILNLLKIDVI